MYTYDGTPQIVKYFLHPVFLATLVMSAENTFVVPQIDKLQ